MGLGRAINPLGADSLAQLLRLIAYGVVSMMLELCSMIGLTLVSSRGRSRGLDVPESVARGEKTRVLCGVKSVPPLIGFGGPSSWDSLDACGEGSLKSVDGEFDSASKVVVKNSKPMVGRGGEGGSISEIINNKLVERVHPSLVPKKSYIANIEGVLNAIIIAFDAAAKETSFSVIIPTDL